MVRRAAHSAQPDAGNMTTSLSTRHVYERSDKRRQHGGDYAYALSARLVYAPYLRTTTSIHAMTHARTAHLPLAQRVIAGVLVADTWRAHRRTVQARLQRTHDVKARVTARAVISPYSMADMAARRAIRRRFGVDSAASGLVSDSQRQAPRGRLLPHALPRWQRDVRAGRPHPARNRNQHGGPPSARARTHTGRHGRRAARRVRARPCVGLSEVAEARC